MLTPTTETQNWKPGKPSSKSMLSSRSLKVKDQAYFQTSTGTLEGRMDREQLFFICYD